MLHRYEEVADPPKGDERSFSGMDLDTIAGNKLLFLHLVVVHARKRICRPNQAQYQSLLLEKFFLHKKARQFTAKGE